MIAIFSSMCEALPRVTVGEKLMHEYMLRETDRENLNRKMIV
jgi:hypothetical protein